MTVPTEIDFPQLSLSNFNDCFMRKTCTGKFTSGKFSGPKSGPALQLRHLQQTMSDDDPFECRLTFTSLLQKLNASQQSIHKVANYAMRHRRLSEDLYSCVLEELEQVSGSTCHITSPCAISFSPSLWKAR